jgi:hypothetical protein
MSKEVDFTDKLIKTVTPWAVAIGSLVSAVLGLVSFGYDTFASKETVTEVITRIDQRLDRIENKIDAIRERN